MYLTQEEEKMLDGEQGEATRKAMKLLVRLGEVYGAEKMIEVSSAQASGVSYKSIGDPGIEFLEGFAQEGARTRIPTYLNPAGMDLDNWKKFNFPKDFAKKQQQIINAFVKMGVTISATCTPYYASALPRENEHIAWAESSAVSFANSVIGAYTNREGGPSALAAAITGRTPEYGLHLDENRKAQVVINVEPEEFEFGLLGNLVGKKVKNKIPYFKGIKKAATDDLKYLGAAMAASGAVALYYVEGITPKSENQEIKGLEKITITEKELEERKDELTTGEKPDLIAFGCPHLSISEIKEINELLEGKKMKTKLWLFTSTAVKSIADRMGYTKSIEKKGGDIITDTCMVVSPIEQMGFETVAVNSGKAAQYLPGFCKQKVIIDSMENLLRKWSE